MTETVISIELIEELAKAARINLTKEEKERYAQQLAVILDAFKKLDEVPTVGVKPSYHPIEITGALRDDSSRKWVWDPLKNVNDEEEGYIRGPRIK